MVGGLTDCVMEIGLVTLVPGTFVRTLGMPPRYKLII